MKVLIVGFGSIARKHFEALASFKFKAKISVLSKSLDLNEAKSLGVAKVYRDINELNLNEFDFFIISNITTEHFKTLDFINSRVQNKTILVEKPLFEKDYEFESKQNVIFVAYLLRFHPVIRALKRLLKKEQVYFASLTCNSYLPNWRSVDYRQNYSAKKELGGGVLLDLSHELDLAFYLFGDLSLKYAQNAKVSELEINSDDFAFLALQNDALSLHIQLDYFSKFNHRQIIATSKDKSFKADLIANKLEIYDKFKLKKTLTYQSNTIAILQKMYKNIFKNSLKLCDISQARRVLRLCDELKNTKEKYE